MSDLTTTIQPTSRLLLDPAAATARLGLPSSAATALEPVIAGASQAVATALTFDPWYQQLREDFFLADIADHGATDPAWYDDLSSREAWNHSGPHVVASRPLPLAARPFVRVGTVTAGGTTLVLDTDFAVRQTRRRAGDVYLEAVNGWTGFILGSATNPLAPVVSVPYAAGWWLPVMSGERPSDVAELPADIADACLLMVQLRFRSDASNPLWKAMEKANVRLEFRDKPVADLQAQVESTLAAYRPLVFA